MYNYLNDKEIVGELNLWRACVKQHVLDLILPESSEILQKAKLFLFGNNDTFPIICLLLNRDLCAIRRRITKLHQWYLEASNSKTSEGKIEVKKMLLRFTNDLLYE